MNKCPRTVWFLLLLAGIALLFSCGALKRSGLVGGGGALGAGAGLALGGPGGAVAGAAVGAMATSAVVEADASNDRADAYAAAGRPYVPPAPEPSWFARQPWWIWLLALWLWLRRAHLWSAITGKEPRWDAILRALGIRTHKKPIPQQGG